MAKHFESLIFNDVAVAPAVLSLNSVNGNI